MMDEATRTEFLARIKREVTALTDHDHDVLKHLMPVILKLTNDPRLGPVTLLSPDEQAIERIDFDTDQAISSELRDRMLGLLLDQVILGRLPAPQLMEDSEQTQLSTLGGASATLTAEDGRLVLTDTFGRKVRVSEPVVDGPKVTWRISDDLLMWDEWAWL
jgi:hypothetical protein